MRALAFHQCVPGSIPGHGVICRWSLLLVLFLAPRGFSQGTPVFPSPQKPTFPNSTDFDLDYCQALYHEPLARVIAQALFVFDIKFTFTLYNNTHPDNHTMQTTDTPGFKPFTMIHFILLIKSSQNELLAQFSYFSFFGITFSTFFIIYTSYNNTFCLSRAFSRRFKLTVNK